MEIFLYRKGSDKVEEGFTREELPELLANPDNLVWVDLRGDCAEGVELTKDVLANVFKFHYLTIEDCLETRNQPKVEGFPDYLYFIVHGVKPDETTSTNFVTKELDGYLGSNYVITFHVEKFQSIKVVKSQVRASTFAMQRGAAYLLHQILDCVVDLYMPVVDDFDTTISDLEERVFRMKRSSNQILSEIMDVRRSVARLKRISSRQLEVMYRMSHGEFTQIPKETLPFFRDVHDHLLRMSDLAENYRDLVGGLFEIHLAVVSNKMNEVMKTLAVMSGILLPLTLIAGIYGMNFDNMPELKTANGYFVVIGVMVFITLMLLFYFWRRGWIFQPEDEIPESKTPVAEDEDGHN